MIIPSYMNRSLKSKGLVSADMELLKESVIYLIVGSDNKRVGQSLYNRMNQLVSKLRQNKQQISPDIMAIIGDIHRLLRQHNSQNV